MNGNQISKMDTFIDIIWNLNSRMASVDRELQKTQHAQTTCSDASGILFDSKKLQRVCHIIEVKMDENRSERELSKSDPEKVKTEKMQTKQLEQLRLEKEITDIENDNYLCTHIHSFIGHIVSIEDINEVLTRCEYEQQNNVPDGFFGKRYPSDSLSKLQAESEADKMFDVEGAEKDYRESNKEWSDLMFEKEEPTLEGVASQLETEAMGKISSFLPWKQTRLRKEYVLDNLDKRFKFLHDRWQTEKEEYESAKRALFSKVEEKNWIAMDMKQSKSNYIDNRSKMLYDAEIEAWEHERDEFYRNFQNCLQNVIEGDPNYVKTAINSIFPCNGIPMEFFVDFVYEAEIGRVMVDINLPAIEDLPERKIVLTPTGRKSIRMKGQTDLRSDYAHCVLGLAMYVAYLIFNVSLKIRVIEVSGFTQRRGVNSALLDDQYIFITRFERDVFAKIDFSRFSSLQVMDFFKHCLDMTKGYDMKGLSLGTAYSLMDNFIPADYGTYLKRNPATSGLELDVIDPKTTSMDMFDNASNLVKDISIFIDRLSRLMGVFSDRYYNGLSDRMEKESISWKDNIDTNNGVVFLCIAIDMLRCLEKMHFNPFDITPASYSLAIFLIKMSCKKEVEYAMMKTQEQTYKSQMETLKSISNRLPVQGGYYLYEDIFMGNQGIMAWYHVYLELMGKYIAAIRDSIMGNTLLKWQADRILKEHRDYLSVVQKTYAQEVYEDKEDKNEIYQGYLDPLFSECAELIVATGQASTSMLQRKFQIGYNRAGRIMDQMEAYGIVGPYNGSQPRAVLVFENSELQTILKEIVERKA